MIHHEADDRSLDHSVGIAGRAVVSGGVGGGFHERRETATPADWAATALPVTARPRGRMDSSCPCSAPILVGIIIPSSRKRAAGALRRRRRGQFVSAQSHRRSGAWRRCTSAKGSREYRVLHNWIRGGLTFAEEKRPAMVALRMEPARAVLPFGAKQPLKVIARYADGQEADVTWQAVFHSMTSAWPRWMSKGW